MVDHDHTADNTDEKADLGKVRRHQHRGEHDHDKRRGERAPCGGHFLREKAKAVVPKDHADNTGDQRCGHVDFLK